MVNTLKVTTAHFSARGAAESVETLDKLRQTRDTLNDILTENDQLRIEVTFDTFFLCVLACI